MKKIALFLILSAFAAFAFGQKKESLAVVKVKPTAAVEAAVAADPRHDARRLTT